jgi:hypothetical protein
MNIGHPGAGLAASDHRRWAAWRRGGGINVMKPPPGGAHFVVTSGHPRSLAAGCERSLADRGTSEGRQPLAPEASKSGYVLG